MRTFLDDRAGFKNHDQVGETDCGQPVRDENGDTAYGGGDFSGYLLIRVAHALLSDWVKCVARLVEAEQQRIGAHHRPGQSDTLPLPAGQLGAVVVAVAEQSRQPAVETFQHRTRTGTLDRTQDGAWRVDVRDPAHSDALLQGEMKLCKILEERRATFPDGVDVDVCEVDAVN